MVGFFEKLGKLFAPTRPAGRYYYFQVRCRRCSEVLEGRVDLYNDPSLDFETGKAVYICRKVLIGNGHCFQKVEVTFKFDEARKILERQVTGGEIIESPVP